MSTGTANIVFDNSSTANFRSWGSGIASLLTTGGFWVKTSDTGQIDWTTVTVPGTNTVAGYEIYRTNDTLNSLFPVYLKIEYGTSGIASGPSWAMTFGTSTNGAGTITGTVSSRYGFPGTSTAGTGATTYLSFASGSEGRFGLHIWNVASPSITFGFVIERSMDSAGAYTSNYVTWCLLQQQSGTYLQRTMLKPSLGTFTAADISNAYTLFWSGSAAAGTFAAPFPVFPFLGYPDNPMTAIMGMKSNDIVEGGTLDVIMYGASRHYIWTNRITMGGSVVLGFGMRYD